MNTLSVLNTSVNNLRPRAALRRLTLRSLLAVTLLPTLSAAFSCVGIAPVHAAPRSETETQLELAPTSRLLPLTLPSGALRSTDDADVAKFADILRALAQPNKFDVRQVEVVAWSKGKDARTALLRNLKALNYNYVVEPALKVEGDKLTVFVAVMPERKNPMLALWVDHGNTALLAWASLVPTAERAANTTVPNSSPAPNSQNSEVARAQAMKKLSDYNYVKYFGPISGRMYRSTKW